jgi:hypothetical protein
MQAKICGVKYVQYILISEKCIEYMENTYAVNIMYPSDFHSYVLRDENLTKICMHYVLELQSYDIPF